MAARKHELSNGRVREKEIKPPSVAQLLQLVFIRSKALKTFLTNFLLVYNIRAGVAILIRALTLIPSAPKNGFSLSRLLDEKDLKFREEAFRSGLLVGGFTGIYKAVMYTLARFDSPKEGDSVQENGLNKTYHSAIGGFFAGFALMFMDKSWHRTLALYMATRAVQCWYNFNKARGRFHFWGSDWNHGDSLLFIVASAQIMYAYVMRPETLPPSYYRFIVKQGPIDGVILRAVRDSCRGNSVDKQAVMEYVRNGGGENAVKAVQPFLDKAKVDMIPCRALHPYTTSCSYHSFRAFVGVAKQIFGVYLSLALVPAVVLRFKTFVAGPGSVILRSILSACRSAAFLSAYCSGYQAVVCVQREIFEHFKWGDNKFVYWFAAMISGLSILIEKKSRRSELALYALPRAADSVFLILNDRKLAFAFPQGELLLFCTSMSAVMFFYENHRKLTSPLVVKLLQRFLSNDKILTLDAGNRDTVSEASSSTLEDDDALPRRNRLKLGEGSQRGSTLSLSGSLITP